MRIDRYRWHGGTEAMLRFGPDESSDRSHFLVAILPVLEEANRTRTFVVRLLRLLAERGIASVLPDLPATGESALPTAALDPHACSEALATLVATLGVPCHTLALRSGCLLDAAAPVAGRYHLSPITGAQVLRDLGRTRQAEANGREKLSDRWFLDPHWQESAGHVRIAGNLLSSAALAAFEPMVPARADRTARLVTDAAPADVHLDGKPLWRTKEPDDDPALALALAEDIQHWLSACAG